LAQFSLTQKEMDVINPNWILLDMCSTVSVMCNPALVRNIMSVHDDDGMTIITNGRSQFFNQTATLNILPLRVHFKQDSLANILSLSDIANLTGARITMDSTVEKAINLFYDGKVLKFEECCDGLYYLDTSKSSNYYNSTVTNYSNPSSSKTSFVQTVNSNKEFFTKSEIDKADKARLLQSQLGWPSTQAFIKYVNNNLITNCGITGDDIHRAHVIYGPPVPILKGKMTRAKPGQQNLKRIPLPPPILANHRDLHLYMDFFYVNKIPFLHTKTSKVNFLTVQSGPNRSKGSIKAGIATVLDIYHVRGFQITNFHGDNEFDLQLLRDFIRPASLHIYGRNEHVGVVEWSIRTIKECCRCMCNAVPFKRYTKLMTKHLVDTAVYWLNSFPSENSVSSTLSPGNIVLG
jgi:hypothetical protein